MVEKSMKSINAYDPEIARVLELELMRQRTHIELIASENLVSPEVMAVMGSVLTNKYAEGYPGHRYYGGCEYVDLAENICIERAKMIFDAKFANVQAHSGSQANYAVYLALCKPGDTVMGMSLNEGGHLTHGSKANFSGKTYNIVPYGLDPATGRIDYDQVRAIAKECRPRMIIAGASAYPRAIDFKAFSEIAHEVGAYLMVDIAHIAGLVAAGEHQSPMPYADVVTTTTHKTMRGPRGGIIMTNDAEIAKKIDTAMFPGTQGGPLMHIIAAKAVALGEALRPEFKTYQHQIVANAAELAKTLLDGGMELVSGGTDNHLMLVDVMSKGRTGMEVQELLDMANITANKNTIPFDTQSVKLTSGMRFGTPAVTTRGMREAEMAQIAQMSARLIDEGASAVAQVKEQTVELCRAFPLYPDIK